MVSHILLGITLVCLMILTILASKSIFNHQLHSNKVQNDHTQRISVSGIGGLTVKDLFRRVGVTPAKAQESIRILEEKQKEEAKKELEERRREWTVYCNQQCANTFTGARGGILAEGPVEWRPGCWQGTCHCQGNNFGSSKAFYKPFGCG